MALEAFQLIYCVMSSDEVFINNILDAELYQVDMIFSQFFKIYKQIRPTNTIKTHYLFQKLMKFAQKNFNIFLKRYPQIKKRFIKTDPQSGQQFLQF